MNIGESRITEADYQAAVRAVKEHIVRRHPSADRLLELFDLLAPRSISSAPLGHQGVYKLLYPKKDVQQALREGESSAKALKRSLQIVLREFEASPAARTLGLRISLPPGRDWRLLFEPVHDAPLAFWKPYFDRVGSGVTLIFNELLLFRSRQDRYLIRHLDLNDETDDIREVCQFLPSEHEFEPARFAVPAGEANAIIRLTQWFERHGIHCNHLISHLSQARSALEGRNLVILGSNRTFPLLRGLLREQRTNFELERDRILNAAPSRGEKAEYVDDFSTPGVGRGLVVRFRSASLDGWLTIIASNHNRFFQVVADSITGNLGALCPQSFKNRWPDSFELLAEVPVEQYEANPMHRNEIVVVASRSD